MIARAILIAAVTAIAAPAAHAAAALPRITISYSQEAGDLLPMWVTLDGGYFKQHGLDVTELLIPSQQGVPALLAGDEQMASLGAADTLAAVAQGVKLKYVVAHAPPLEFQLWARPEYNTPAKLRGQKVAIPSTTGSAYVGTVLALKQIGLRPSDVIMTIVGNAQNTFAAFMAGSVAANVGNPPQIFTYKERGFALLADTAKSNIPNVMTGLVVLDSYIPAHRAIIEDAVEAFIEGLRRERTDRAFTEQEMRKHLRFTDQATLDKTYDFFARPISGKPPLPDTAMLASVQGVLGVANPKIRAVDLNSMVDQSFVKAAAKTEETR